MSPQLAARCRMADALIRLKPPIPGFYIYYPGRRELSPALAAFIDEVRSAGEAESDSTD
jgi:DNA-binding transcriptional LysR family regulator